MGNPILKRVSRREINGWVREEILSDLPSNFFDDPISLIHDLKGEVIKESKWRWAALLRLPNGRRVFLKGDKTKGWMEYIKYLFLPSKGQKEFLIASQLENKNLNIPKPLGWMERVQRVLVRESYFLSEAIGTGVSFIDEGLKSRDPISITELAMTVRKFQDTGLFHRDLHGGNFLWEGSSIFFRGGRRFSKKKDFASKDLSSYGPPSTETVAKQNETVLEGKYRIYDSRREGDSLFSSKGFSNGSSKKGDGRTPNPGKRTPLFPDQMFSRSQCLHIE